MSRCSPDQSGGGANLVYLSHGDVPFFRVLFYPLFLNGVSKRKAILLEPVVKTSQRGTRLGLRCSQT